MAVGLDFIQAQLQSIRTELREMKFAAEVDRRNARSHYDNLVVEVGTAIGRMDANVEMMAEHLEGRLDSMEGRLDNLAEQLGGRLDNIDAKLNRLLEGA